MFTAKEAREITNRMNHYVEELNYNISKVESEIRNASHNGKSIASCRIHSDYGNTNSIATDLISHLNDAGYYVSSMLCSQEKCFSITVQW